MNQPLGLQEQAPATTQVNKITPRPTSRTFAQLLAQEDYQPPQPGEIWRGEVLIIQPNAVIVDIGAKRDAIIPQEDLKRVDEAVLEELNVGDAVPVYVLKPVGHDDTLIGSLSKGLEQEDWRTARQLLESKDVVEGKVLAQNKGGLLVEYRNLRAFVPNSHIPSLGFGLTPEELRQAKDGLVGDVLSFVIIEADPNRWRLVASPKAAERKLHADKLLEFAAGEVRMGTVTSLADFGAFVDIEGVVGLLHISELAWTRVAHPQDVVKVGDAFEVLILEVDVERQRIRLSRKRVPPAP